MGTSTREHNQSLVLTPKPYRRIRFKAVSKASDGISQSGWTTYKVEQNKTIVGKMRDKIKTPLKQRGFFGTEYAEHTFLFKEDETSVLEASMAKRKDGMMALYDLTHNEVCTKSHKYRIWRHFRNGGTVEFHHQGKVNKS
jgi:hypothetical protein